MHGTAVHMLALRSLGLLQTRAGLLKACTARLLMAPRPAKRQRSTVTCSMIDNRCASGWPMQAACAAGRFGLPPAAAAAASWPGGCT